MRTDSRSDAGKKLQTLRLRTAAAAENLRGSLWFMPSLMVLGTLLLAGALARVETPMPRHPVADLLVPRTVEGARSVLQVVAGSVVTVTSVVFSLTVVALQMSATNYSPRVLRTFLRSRGTKSVLGIFLATFAYSFVILQNLDSGGGGTRWSPQLAVGLLVPFVLASLVALVFFIHHVTQSIRVDTILRDVLEETVDAIEKVYAGGDRVVCPLTELIPDRARAIQACRSGYIQAVNPEAFVSRLSEYGVIVGMRPVLGDYVVQGAIVGWAWTRGDETEPPDVQAIEDAFDDAVHFGTERTMQQDVPFGLRQLVDVGVRALSPGVNDPNTAVAVLSHLTKAYALLARKDLGHRVYSDETGRTCLIVPGPDLDEYLHISTQQISYYGRSDVMVLERLLRMLGEIHAISGGRHTEAIQAHVQRVVDQAHESLDLERDLEVVREAAEYALKGSPNISHLTRAG